MWRLLYLMKHVLFFIIMGTLNCLVYMICPMMSYILQYWYRWCQPISISSDGQMRVSVYFDFVDRGPFYSSFWFSGSFIISLPFYDMILYQLNILVLLGKFLPHSVHSDFLAHMICLMMLYILQSWLYDVNPYV